MYLAPSLAGPNIAKKGGGRFKMGEVDRQNHFETFDFFEILVRFQAAIKSAASAAFRKPKSREGRSRGVQDGGSAGGRRPRGTPLELHSLDLGFLKAALAADLITA